MKEVLTEQEKQRRREYHRRWRAEHPEQVKAAQLRYWMKKAQRQRNCPGIPENVEIRENIERA